MAHASDESVHVAETFARVAGLLAAHQHDMQGSLDKIVRLAVANLDACEFAGISLSDRGKITSPASTGDVAHEVDAIQAETGEGPCVEAIRQHVVFRSGDLANEDRWPQFSRRAYESTGISSVVAIPLFVGEDTLGALNLYSRTPNAFDDSDVALGSVFAVHASVAMSAAQRVESLEKKVESRDVIGRAKGILMAQSGVTDEEAFDLLKRASQRMNVKLREIAERINERSPSEP